MLSRKGGAAHRRWGEVFCSVLLLTGTCAVGMSVSTLIDPLGTHRDLHDARMIRDVFGWMMLYLGILTVSLAWHGLAAVRNKQRVEANRTPFAAGLQIATIAAAANCAIRGYLDPDPMIQALMMGISVVGVASGATNLWFIYRTEPTRAAYLKEHVKALVGAGISAYTAFLAFGMVRLSPEHALNPIVWSIPLIVGLSIIVWHHRRIDGAARSPAPNPRPPQPRAA